MVHTCNFIIQEAEAEGIASLRPRTSLKNKNEKQKNTDKLKCYFVRLFARFELQCVFCIPSTARSRLVNCKCPG